MVCWTGEDSGVFVGDVLEGAGDSGADGSDGVTGGFGLLDSLDGGGRKMKPFGVHVVGFDVVLAYRLEGAEADVEGEVDDFDAFGSDTVEEVLCQVKGGGGGGD